MKRLGTAVLLGFLLFGTMSPARAAVVFDQPRVNETVGGRFTLKATVTNSGATPTGEMIAHLNVASLTDDVYVDPEDWSTQRSQKISSLPPGASTSTIWPIQAVNAGSFDVYVVLLPVSATPDPAAALTTSGPVHLAVASRATISAAGTLPVAIIVPGLLVLIWAFTRRKAG